MKKIKILKAFTDVKTKQLYLIGQEVEVNQERFEEMKANLEAFGGGYLEVIDDKTKMEEEVKSKNKSKKKG